MHYVLNVDNQFFVDVNVFDLLGGVKDLFGLAI